MSNLKFELNSEGVKELLRSDEMEEVLTSYAEEIKARVGEEYSTDCVNLSSRKVASVYTEDKQAINENFDNNTLWRAMR